MGGEYTSPTHARSCWHGRIAGPHSAWVACESHHDDPVEALLQLSAGSCASRALHAVADLGVADALDDIPQRAASLAAATGADAGALDRVLRLLALYGTCDYRDETVLMAHMDTVYERGMPAQQPFRIDGDRAYCLGIADDKHGIAVLFACDRSVPYGQAREGSFDMPMERDYPPFGYQMK